MHKLYDHAAYRRVVCGQSSATDRQWLRMLTDAFETVRHEELVKAGMDPHFATEFLGLVALSVRFRREYPGDFNDASTGSAPAFHVPMSVEADR